MVRLLENNSKNRKEFSLCMCQTAGHKTLEARVDFFFFERKNGLTL